MNDDRDKTQQIFNKWVSDLNEVCSTPDLVKKLNDRVDELEAANSALVTLLAIKFHDFADYYNTYHKTALENIKKEK